MVMRCLFVCPEIVAQWRGTSLVGLPQMPSFWRGCFVSYQHPPRGVLVRLSDGEQRDCKWASSSKSLLKSVSETYGIGIVQVNQAANQDSSPSFLLLPLCPLVSSVPSTMGDMRDGAVFLDKHVEPVRVEVPGHHAAGLDDARRLREVLLAECLEKEKSSA